MSSGVCEAINEVDKYIVLDPESKDYTFKDNILEAYCPAKKKGGKRECDSNGLKVGSAFIALLKLFKSVDDEDKLESDKLAEYAVLWLSYKIKQNKKILFGVSNIYEMITHNEWYTDYREYIDKKKNIMGLYDSYLINLYKLLKKICDTINKCNDPSKTKECIENAKMCATLYQHCADNCPWKRDCSPYCNVLSNLKSDYDKFRETNHNKNDLPELKLPDGGESCESYCKSKGQKLNAEDQVTEEQKSVTPTENSLSDQPSTEVGGSQEGSVFGIEGDMHESNSITLHTSINNGNKLPYIAVPFVLIPIILGISYKYLIHGRGKKVKKKKNAKNIINLCEEK